MTTLREKVEALIRLSGECRQEGGAQAATAILLQGVNLSLLSIAESLTLLTKNQHVGRR